MPEQSMRYEFSCEAESQAGFTVVAFEGREAVSECYEFDVTLAGPKGLDLDAMVESQAQLTISTQSADFPYHGVISALDQLQEVGELALYSARLVPKFAMLDYALHSQVFLDKTLPEIIQSVLKSAHISNFQLQLQESYPSMEYVCQFNETHLDFLSRWMEQHGLYYFFKQEESGEVLVITDSIASINGCLGSPLLYAPPSGLNEQTRRRALVSLMSRRTTGPSKVLLKNYNYLKPSLNLEGTAQGAASGLGETFAFGDGFRTPSEGDALAQVRAQELSCRRITYVGESLAPGLRAGYSADIDGHFRDDCNGSFFLMSVDHRGHQSGRLPAGLDGVIGSPEDLSDYEADFTAIPADVQFRPERVTPKPSIPGVISAVVETEGTGEYAMLDDLGRYKVRLPFDLSGHANTKASCWVRKAEPYAGAGHGMHFPLQAGTEVLLDFMNGDIDRPYIAAAVTHAEAVSQVTNSNSAANIIRSAANNQFIMSDKRGQEYISLWSPYHQSGIAIGSVFKGGGGSIHSQTVGDSDSLTFGDSNSAIVGTSNSATGGFKNIFTLGVSNTVSCAVNTSFSAGVDLSGFIGYKIAMGSSSYSLNEDNTLSGLNELKLTGGISTAVASTAKSAKKALLMGCIGAAAGAAGASLMFESEKDGGLNCKGAVSEMVCGSLLGAAGAALSTISSVWAVNMIKAFDKASENAAAGELTLNGGGAFLAVNSIAGTSPTLRLIQGPTPVQTGPNLPTISEIKMSDSGGSVSITNQSTASLTMDTGSVVTLGLTDIAGVTKYKLTIDATSGVTLEGAATGCKVTMNNDQIEMQKLTGYKCVISADSAMLTDTTGNNGFMVDSSGAAVAMGTNGMDVSSTGVTLLGSVVSAKPDGTVTLA